MGIIDDGLITALFVITYVNKSPGYSTSVYPSTTTIDCFYLGRKNLHFPK